LTKLTVALFTALSEFDVVVWEALPMDHEESFDLATRGSVGWKLKAMSGDIGRFLAAYLTQTFSMCLLLVVLILTFGAWKLDQFVRGFFILFVLSIATIPQRLIIPFLSVGRYPCFSPKPIFDTWDHPTYAHYLAAFMGTDVDWVMPPGGSLVSTWLYDKDNKRVRIPIDAK
jgi:hypothetical protein